MPKAHLGLNLLLSAGAFSLAPYRRAVTPKRSTLAASPGATSLCGTAKFPSLSWDSSPGLSEKGAPFMYFASMRQARTPTFNFGTLPEWCLICIPSYELTHSSHRSIRSLTALICCGFSVQFRMKSKDRVWHITISLSL